MNYAHTYANVENGAIIKLGPRPRWVVDGEPASDEVLRAGGFECDEDGNPLQHPDGSYVLAADKPGWLPVVYEQPEHDATLQRTTLNAQSEWPIETKRVVATYTIHDISIEELHESKLQEATDMRWSVMTGGITLPNGIQVGTDIDDQNRITSVVANAALAGLTDSDEVDFKASSGWVKIPIGQIKQIAGVIGNFVQECYSAERAHHEAIDDLETREDIAAYDVDDGWPEQGNDPDPA